MKILKLLGFLFIISSYLLCCLPLYPIFLIAPAWTRRILIKLVSIHSKAMLSILDINVNYQNLNYLNLYPNYLIVSNHLSYLDVLIIASKLPSCFVTSTEVKASLFLGQLTSLGGCLFVNRKDRRNLKNEVKELRDVLRDGLSVTIFPEATSTNGEGVLKFKRPLFEASLSTNKPILPLTINYRKISSRKIDEKNRDLICWYGGMSFFPHFMELLSHRKIEVDMHLSEPFLPGFLPILELAYLSHQKVSASFQTLTSTPRRHYDEIRTL